MEEYNRYVRIADGDPVKLARMLEMQSWFDNKDQLLATATSMAKYMQQSKKADTPGGSRARVHRAAPLGHGANRFTESDREGAVVGVSIRDGASTRDKRIEHLKDAVCEGVVPERAGGVFVDRTHLQEEKSSWPDDASLPPSPSPFTSSHGAAVCRRGIGGGCPPA